MICFFIKFFKKKQYIEDFVRGKIFANRLSEFKKIESSDSSGRMDPNEGTVAWLQPNNTCMILNGFEIPSNDLAAPVSVQKNWLNHINVFCIHAVHTGDLRLKNLSKSGIEAFRQRLLVPDECLDLGEYAVVVQNVSKFLRRMDTSAKAKGYLYGRQLVGYYSSETSHVCFRDPEAVFQKQSKYSFQREYRFAIWDRSRGVNPIILDIGDISDITRQFKTSELNGEKLLGGHIELHERIDRSQ